VFAIRKCCIEIPDAQVPIAIGSDATSGDSSNSDGTKIIISVIKKLRKYGLIFADEEAIFVNLQSGAKVINTGFRGS